MGFFDFFGSKKQAAPMDDQTKLALIASHSPGLAKFIYDYNLNAQKQNDLNKMSNFAPFIYGEPGQGGAPGTGVYDTTVPNEVRLREMNKRMLQTGLAGFIDQWGKHEQDMQKYVMQGSKNPVSFEEFIRTLPAGQTPDPAQYGQFLKDRKSGINITLGQEDKVIPMSEMKFWRMPDNSKPLGLTPKQAIAKGGVYVEQDSPADQARKAMVANMQHNINELQNMLFNEKGEINPGIASDMAWLQKGRESVIPGSEWVAAKLTSDKGQVAFNTATRLLSNVLKIESGAAVTAQEMHEIAAAFMPKVGESKEVSQMKFQMFKRYIDELTNSIRPDMEDAIGKPLARQINAKYLNEISKLERMMKSGQATRQGYPTHLDNGVEIKWPESAFKK